MKIKKSICISYSPIHIQPLLTESDYDHKNVCSTDYVEMYDTHSFTKKKIITVPQSVACG